ncbi:hypothetical protein [Bradyrhizobium sp. G127]|uniref:hypothetical protein n=1 Tax=Bradyrhizobium sp. G127 TaxID=2904800 RepID=UPI001F2C6696|nr:hypothetical protein [Bradyrhizobium sp. G127]MCF2521692.1 hypothetical protein [Bradyrhizobium sp. G127]
MTVPAAVKDGWTIAADRPVKHWALQAAMKMHLSQVIGAGAFDGQHGMSFAISSVVAGADMPSIIACVEASEDACAITGRDSGTTTSPTIAKITSKRLMNR